jgi:hypothetical protein
MAPPVLTMTARDVLLLHWPVRADRLRPRIPAALDLRTAVSTGGGSSPPFTEGDRRPKAGTAWLSAVLFRAEDLRPRGVPARFGRTCPEFRLVTYVRTGGTPGRLLLSVDVGDGRLARLFRLASGVPYVAADARVDRTDGDLRYRSRRSDGAVPPARVDVACRPVGDAGNGPSDTGVGADAGTGPGADDGRPSPPDRWLHGHDRVFGTSGGYLRALDVRRPAPPLRPAEVRVRENDLFRAAGVPTPAADPLARFARAWRMDASLPFRPGASG